MKNKQPKIFTYTAYRLPSQEDIKEINDCNLNASEIIEGFKYTIIGKGILSDKNKNDIIKSISMLVSAYPENIEYKKALDLAKEIGNKINESSKILIKRLIRENLGF